MLYSKLTELYTQLSSTTKRLEKIEILSKFFKKLDEKESYILYLLEGNIYPSYDERKIGISNQLAIKSISKATGTNQKKIQELWRKMGDLGEVSKKLTETKTQRTLASHTLTTIKVLENLRKLPELIGKGTIDKKISLITELLTSASPEEALYLVRTLLGDLRIGVQESTIKYSLLKAFFNDDKEKEPSIQRAIDKTNDLAKVFEISKKSDIKKLDSLELEVGKPIKAMLAQKTISIKQAFKDLGKPLAAEYKYDGFRLLIHKKGDKITLFTRRLENVTKQFPEVERYIQNNLKGKSFILDSEAVGYDKKTKKYTDFQAISQRIRRKHNIKKLEESLPVEINIFDILYYNGKSLLDKPFKERTKLLRKIIKKEPFKIAPSKMIITSSEKEIEKFYKEALKNNQEGIMLKNLDAEYKPGRRVGHMLKLKPNKKDFDLVITGAEWGTGKRKGWLSSFTLSCKKGNKFLEIGKSSTGLKEKKEEGLSYEELTDLLKPHIEEQNERAVKISPKIVVAVTYQDIQKSSNYESGLALRFPRFVALREDKPISEITTLEELEEEFIDQKKENYKYN
ncbi:DNA ligase [Candidatus Pacearchaeota archaeon ex4484_71]|nr:MAG: DNA ligase [Candidatus Pacearchaeota archaeon ex4484_71]